MILDAAFGVLLVIAIIIGWRGGLIGRLGAWIGFAIGALAAARWTTDGVNALNIDGGISVWLQEPLQFCFQELSDTQLVGD